MRFRKTLIAQEISLHPDGVNPLVLVAKRTHDVRVVLETEDSEHGSALSCVAETEFEPSQRVREAFESLAARWLPPGHVPREEWIKDIDYIDEEGNFGNYIVPLYIMPEGFRSFASQVDGELNEAIRDVFGLLRWRSRTLGPRAPFSSRGTEWSLDGEVWEPLPRDTSLELLASARLQFTEEATGELQRLLAAGETEPLAHELFREAWSQRRSNPRSSMLVAMTALEVGIKQYISACVPKATWLAENAPMPPVVAMLREYVPTLEPPGGSATGPFPDDVLAAIKVAVNIRNQLAHLGAEIAPERLLTTLRAVRNILWTFDEARGHRWARAHRFPSLEEDLSEGYRRI
jgi:hypothetical protein